jgi:hypothetical protein
MLFSTKIGNSAIEGELCEKFLRLHELLIQIEKINPLSCANFGWQLLEHHLFSSDYIVKYCSNEDS